MSDVFSPYQIDYSVKNTSKTFGFSKKKIEFKFGIANPPAVANGESGANCRGSEHHVVFTWSLNSGKRQIVCDGKDVHYSETGQNGWTADQVFQHHFQLRVAGLSGPLRVHLITQPANRDVPHIKPFDIRVNGVSYFSMPQIFQLGTPQMVVRPVKGKTGGRMGSSRGGMGGGYSNRGSRNEDDSHLSPTERQAIAAAKLASMQEMQRGGGSAYGSHHAPPAPAVVDDLISFDAPAPPPATAPYNQYGQQQPPPPQQGGYSNYSLGAAPPVPPPQQQFQQQQSSQGSFYGQQPQPPPVPPQQQMMQQGSQGSFYGQGAPAAYNNTPVDPHQQFMTSPNAKSVASYQSYGSAPAFAQPPQQAQPPQPQYQQQQPQYQQQQQQQPQQGYYGQQQGY